MLSALEPAELRRLYEAGAITLAAAERAIKHRHAGQPWLPVDAEVVRRCEPCRGYGCRRCGRRGYFVDWSAVRRTAEERRAARAAGLDRNGDPLPRATGENPRGSRREPPVRSAAPPGRTARAAALRVDCPRCGAAAGEPCQGLTGPRSACHAARHEAIS